MSIEEIEARLDRRREHVRAFLKDHEGAPFRSPSRDGWTLLVSRDPSKPHQWRVTRFEGELPVGHVECLTYAAAVDSVYDYGGHAPGDPDAKAM